MKDNRCKICDHPRVDDIERMIRAGISANAICKAFGNEFSTPTLRRHKSQHMDARDPVPEVSEEVPDDLLGYGLEATIATIARLRYRMSVEPTPRNAEALSSLLGRLLDYDKAIKASQGDTSGPLEIRITQAHLGLTQGQLESTQGQLEVTLGSPEGDHEST